MTRGLQLIDDDGHYCDAGLARQSSVVSVRMWDAGWGTGTPWGNGSDDGGELRSRPPLRAMLPLRIMIHNLRCTNKTVCGQAYTTMVYFC